MNALMDWTAPLAAIAALILAALAAKRDLGAPLVLGSLAIGLSAAVLAVLAQAWLHNWDDAIIFASLIVICALIAETDRRRCIIPNLLVIAVALLALASPTPATLLEKVCGAGLMWLLFHGVRLAFARNGKAESLGLGDVKLAAAMGAFLGPTHALVAVAVAGGATLAVISGARLGARGARAQPPVGAPFGVGLAAALALVGAAQLAGLA